MEVARWELASLKSLQCFCTVRWAKDTTLIWMSDSSVDFINPFKLYTYQRPFAWEQNRICWRREKNIRVLPGRLLQAPTGFTHVAAPGLYAPKGWWDRGKGGGIGYIQTGHLYETFVNTALSLFYLCTHKLSLTRWWKCAFGGYFFIMDKMATGRHRTMGIMSLRKGDWWRKQEMWT